jgi:Tfp pilus assembly protein PilX
MRSAPSVAHAQAGVVLFVAMTVLLVMSILAMFAAMSAISESKMAASMRGQQLAQFATASALDEGRAAVVSIASAFGSKQVCAHLNCAIRDIDAPADALGFMQTAAARTSAIALHTDLAKLSGNDASAHLATNAVYVIEDLGAGVPSDENVEHQRFFRITAGASGGTSQYVDAAETVCGVAQ